MHTHSVDSFRHDHVFLGASHERNERRTWIVILICAAMMIAEVVGGVLFGSVALIADGLHMSTHAGALLIAALAYTYSRKFAIDPRFAFGTGKFGDLAAFTSAIVLAMIALLIAWESLERFLHPVAIAFNEAIPIAVIGLGVNVLSAFLLRDDHGHHRHADEHDHEHEHDHDHQAEDDPYTRDLNLRAAFVHVLADAAVSILVIVGLVAARQFGWTFMDPVMGLVGAIVILSWSWSLVRSAGAVLLDILPDRKLPERITARLERDGDRISDLHLWRVGPGHISGIVALVSSHPQPPSVYKARLADLPGLSHLTVEVEPCGGGH
jgi:cation diffusion facilitator family transporter